MPPWETAVAQLTVLVECVSGRPSLYAPLVPFLDWDLDLDLDLALESPLFLEADLEFLMWEGVESLLVLPLFWC